MVGPDAPSVQAAREALELFEERHVLKVHQIEYLSRDFSMLEDIKGTLVRSAIVLYLFVWKPPITTIPATTLGHNHPWTTINPLPIITPPAPPSPNLSPPLTSSLS